jgi:hypothetical protein
MAGTLTPTPYQTVLDSTGVAVSGAKITTTDTGTGVNAATYTSADLSAANTNPIVADSAGRYVAYLPAGSNFTFAITTSADVAIETQTNVQAVPGAAVNLDIEGTVGEAVTAGQVLYLSSATESVPLTAGYWYLTDSDAAATSTAPQSIGVAVSAIAINTSGTIRLAGEVNSAGAVVVGTTYYIGATPGAIVASAPAFSRQVGVGLTTSSLLLAATTAVPTLLPNPLTQDLLFVDNTYDIGKAGASRPRDVFTSRNTTVGGQLDVTGDITLGDGTAGAPALAFTDDTDTGLRRASGNTLAVVTGGTDRAVFSSSGIVVADGTGFGFDASGYPGTLESQITRGGVGIIKLASIGNTNNEDLTIDLETTANTVAFGSSTGVTDYTFAASAAGVPFIVKVENTHNASASSDAVLNVNAGGTSGGDALVSFTGVGTSWSAGASNSDVKFHIANSATDLLTNTRLTIDGSGNVGIGTSSPSQVVELNRASGSTYLQFSTADVAKTYLGISSLADNPIVGMTAGDFGVRVQGGDFFVSTDSGGSGNMVVKNGGLVGLGTAAPQSLLDVRGAAGAPGVVTVATDELTVVATDVLGSIYAQAPLESSGTDAILVSAAIDFVASATFSATVNSTDIVFRTGASAAYWGCSGLRQTRIQQEAP